MPIVALTANAMKGFENEIEQAGFSGFMTKPIDIASLLADLAVRLGGKRAEASAGDASARPVAQKEAAASTTVDAPIVSRLAGNPRLKPIADRFALQLAQQIGQIHHAIEHDDLPEIARLAHAIKGGGGSVGYDLLFEPSKALEVAVATDDHAAIAEAAATLTALERRIAAGLRIGTRQPGEVSV